jgi:hypothetical protein
LAARIRQSHQEDIKKKIQGVHLVKLLQDHALTGKELAPTRIDAAKFLLNKIVSNAPTEVSGPNGEPIEISAPWLSGRSL